MKAVVLYCLDDGSMGSYQGPQMSKQIDIDFAPQAGMEFIDCPERSVAVMASKVECAHYNLATSLWTVWLHNGGLKKKDEIEAKVATLVKGGWTIGPPED